jgi:hypothetical protein
MLFIYAGSTSQTIDIFIPDSASTTGGGKTGIAFNTASLTAYYRKGATGTATAITLATQTVGGAYSSGGFVEIDATNMPGMYRLDLPNATVDTAGLVHVMLKGASGMAPVVARVMCSPVAVDLQTIKTQSVTAAAGVTFPTSIASPTNITAATGITLTATTGLGNQTANITGNLSGSVGSVTGAVGSVTAAVTAGTVSDKTGYSLTATTGLGNQTANITGNLSGSVGSVTGAVGSVTGAVGSVTGSVGSVTGAVGSVTGNVGGNVVGSVGSVTGAVGSVTAAVTLPSIPAGWITAAGIATGAIDADALASDAVTEIWAGSTAPTSSTIATAVHTTQMTESYNTDGTAPTLAQAIFVTMQRLTEFAISGTTITVKKLDGSTSALTLSLNDATTPTSSTRAT